MKLFEVYTTDLFERIGDNNRVGVYSTLQKARNVVVAALELDVKVIIQSFEVDKKDSEIKLEVYTTDGLEYKSVERDSSSIEYGDSAVFFFNSAYYEATQFKMEQKLIQPVIDAYMEWCEVNTEPEIEYMSNEKFIELSNREIDHVLYHAEMQKKEELKELFAALNAA